MTSFYDEIEIEDMMFDQEKNEFTYPCPCGDLFIITVEELLENEEIARCPSCTLIILVVYDLEEIKEKFSKGFLKPKISFNK